MNSLTLGALRSVSSAWKTLQQRKIDRGHVNQVSPLYNRYLVGESIRAKVDEKMNDLKASLKAAFEADLAKVTEQKDFNP